MRNLKILGLALLALVGVMAVSASAAQAMYVLDPETKDEDGKLLLNLTGTALLGELLVDGLGLKIHCPHGTVDVKLHTDTTMTKLLGEGSALFLECEVLEFDEVCKVKSPGSGGTDKIFAEGKGEAGMEGSNTFADLSSENFTKVEMVGEECPFLEIDGTVNGGVKLSLHNSETLEKVHLALLNDKGLFYGSEKAVLHGELLTEVHDDAVLVHLEEEQGRPWAILLKNL